MKRSAKEVIMLSVLLAVFCVPGMASAGFYAATDQLGYQGTIWNITDGTGPWMTTSAPRDAALYAVVEAPQYDTNYNQLLSSWWEHSLSNQNDSFLQLDDPNNGYLTSASGVWDATKTIFTVNISGQNNPYPYSRFWQPDNGVAWGVTFIDYSYAFTATFSTAATLDTNGFYVNSSDPDTIIGAFIGQFLVTYDVDKNPITDGDIYGFNIAFNKDLFDPDGGTYGTITPYNEFGSTTVVPIPAAVWFLGTGLVGLFGVRRRYAS